MNKKHSLPDIKINTIVEGDSIEKIFSVSETELKHKIKEVFEEVRNGKSLFNYSNFSFSKEITDVSLEGFKRLYNCFSDREIVYMIWFFIDYYNRYFSLNSDDEDDKCS